MPTTTRHATHRPIAARAHATSSASGTLALATLGLAAALAFVPAFGARAAGHTTGEMTADLINAEGETIGSATLTQTASGEVLVRAEASGLEPGVHGFHIHETGVCDPATGFESAGGHYVGEGDPKHGLVEGGPHAGDMANQTVAADGTLVAEAFNPRVTLDGDTNPLADADGSALMIHSGADDYESQPGGDAGSRVACAVIAAPQ